mgnify:CR=1 FL=1|jgi:hypothetical protein
MADSSGEPAAAAAAPPAAADASKSSADQAVSASSIELTIERMRELLVAERE